MPTDQNGRAWTPGNRLPSVAQATFAVAERGKLGSTLPPPRSVLGRAWWGDCSQPASVVALGRFRIPQGAAGARGLGKSAMTTKTIVTVNVDWNVAATARWICLLILMLLA